MDDVSLSNSHLPLSMVMWVGVVVVEGLNSCNAKLRMVLDCSKHDLMPSLPFMFGQNMLKKSD